MKGIDGLTKSLVLVGALNWGLVALAEFDLVATAVGLEFGETNVLSRIVYGLVGLSAAFQIVRAAGRRNELDRSRVRAAA
jgi:uncharacterized membrane protein YuzA (DUF378 family)